MKDVKQKEIASVESYRAEEMVGDVAHALRKRIVEVETPPDVKVQVGRVTALLDKPVGILQLTIEPTRIWAILCAPSPVEYRIAYNTLHGLVVAADGSIVEDENGTVKLLPTE